MGIVKPYIDYSYHNVLSAVSLRQSNSLIDRIDICLALGVVHQRFRLVSNVYVVCNACLTKIHQTLNRYKHRNNRAKIRTCLYAKFGKSACVKPLRQVQKRTDKDTVPFLNKRIFVDDNSILFCQLPAKFRQIVNQKRRIRRQSLQVRTVYTLGGRTFRRIGKIKRFHVLRTCRPAKQNKQKRKKHSRFHFRFTHY